MGTLNLPNRTLAIMDNYPFLRSINNECIDLIAIDPPFAANETFVKLPKPPISQAEFDEEVALAQAHGAAHNEGIGHTRVVDYWNWDDDVHPQWKMRIQDDYPKVHAVIEAVEAVATENEAAYISFMAVCLIECHRVLKPTGSIYVHCDDHANSYLRMLLDSIFGCDSFQNEIVWNRSGGKSDSKKWGRVSDHLLYYAKSKNFTWNQQYQPHNPEYIRKTYRFDDNDGRGKYRKLPLHAASVSGGESGKPWRGYDPSQHNRHWATPTKGIMHQYIVENQIIPDWPKGFPTIQNKLDALERHGLLVHSKNYLPEIKTYLAATKGNAISDFVSDIPMVSGKEDTGYSTQKPLSLYERIIKASSNPGDVILDVFAGCATTAIAAEKLERQWIACDMAYRSWTMLKRRFYQNGIQLEGMSDSTSNVLGELPLKYKIAAQIIGPHELPQRADADPTPAHELQSRRQSRRASTQTANWSGRISKDDAKELLINRFGPVCWGCGYQPKRPNGSLDLTLLEVDHIRARRAAEGIAGDDELYNLALLHRTCNGIKRNRMTLEQLRQYNADNGLLYVNTIGELVDLFEAIQYAAQEIARHAATHGIPQPPPEPPPPML